MHPSCIPQPSTETCDLKPPALYQENLFVRWMSGDKFHLERIIKSKILKQGSGGKGRLYFCPFPSPMTAFLAVFLTLACLAGASYHIQATRGKYFPSLFSSSRDFFLHPKKTGTCYTGYEHLHFSYIKILALQANVHSTSSNQHFYLKGARDPPVSTTLTPASLLGNKM